MLIKKDRCINVSHKTNLIKEINTINGNEIPEIRLNAQKITLKKCNCITLKSTNKPTVLSYKTTQDQNTVTIQCESAYNYG